MTRRCLVSMAGLCPGWVLCLLLPPLSSCSHRLSSLSLPLLTSPSYTCHTTPVTSLTSFHLCFSDLYWISNFTFVFYWRNLLLAFVFPCYVPWRFLLPIDRDWVAKTKGTWYFLASRYFLPLFLECINTYIASFKTCIFMGVSEERSGDSQLVLFHSAWSFIGH